MVVFSQNIGQFLAGFLVVFFPKKVEKSRFRSVDTKSTLGRVVKNRPRPTDFDRPQTLDDIFGNQIDVAVDTI